VTDQELAQRVADAANALTDAATAASDAGLVVQLDVVPVKIGRAQHDRPFVYASVKRVTPILDTHPQ